VQVLEKEEEVNELTRRLGELIRLVEALEETTPDGDQEEGDVRHSPAPEH
jgi:hypothetical protein